MQQANLHKIGKYGKEIGEKSGQLSTKSGKSDFRRLSKNVIPWEQIKTMSSNIKTVNGSVL